ncbi:15-hydroxyprostaglandin dehydrogenase [NAD(+)]-like [Choristoneura fumiferana]|uniref:15-hydroxyprostaglandin dehydrogenase [NAD(+)]-like n=1 Tax=Choristoneura fumiferana TaxID=7141 RepID=UPI003D156E9D
MSYEWQGKVVLITGAANGIGAGVVRLALEEGAKHIAILDVDETTGVAFQNELNAQFGPNRSQFYPCDVTNDEQLFSGFNSVVDDQGSIDVVINNAAIMNDSPSFYKKEIAINVTALVTSTLKALKLMRIDEGGKGGTVINISSIAGLHQSSFTPIYCGTKAAVIQFSNCIGKEDYFVRTGVRVLTVCFGATATSLCSPAKLGSLDKNFTPELMYGAVAANLHIQKTESAAKGVIEAYKLGQSGSTWIATRDLPVRDITDNITTGYEIMGEHN